MKILFGIQGTGIKLTGLAFLLLCLALQSSAQQAKEVIISGKIINLNNRTTLIDISEVGELRPVNNDREIAPDSAGNFSIHFKLREANYFKLGLNELYISPGDRMNMVIDYDRPEKSTFSGSASVANNYLKSIPFPKAGSYLNGGTNLKKTLGESIEYILLLAQQRRAELSAIKNKLSPEFFKLEAGRIDADIINSFKLLAGRFIDANKIPKKNTDSVHKTAYNLTKPYLKKYAPGLQKANFLKLEVVRKNFYRIMDSIETTNADGAKIKDWQYAYELAYYINDASDKKSVLKLRPKLDSVKNIEYRKAVKELFDQKTGFWDGDIAVDFKTHDVKNNTVSLSDFKGKIIYIDLWAPWCGPCLEDMPFLDSLRKKYADNPEIVFLSLCLDQNTDMWRKYIQKNNPTGLQLYTNWQQLIPYKVTSIPRAIIIGKDFKVVKMNAPTPSHPGLPAFLDALLKANN
jgi:thiol-disulfide isomerase/thioredoxin